MKILFHKQYQKRFVKLPAWIKQKAHRVIDIFLKYPFEKSLRNHGLSWEYSWFRSIDVTGDYRIIFRELSDDTYELVELIDVGSHSQLYR